MREQERFRLRFGDYSTPRFLYGARVWDKARGWVKIVGLTNGRIPWPKGIRAQERSAGIVLYGALAKAVRYESNQAVAHWWGVTGQTVRKWRKALDVPSVNRGTRAIFVENGNSEWAGRGRRKASKKARDPRRRAKISAALRGKKPPPHVVAAVIRAHLGTHHTAETRQKMSEAHRRRGTRPPWAAKSWTAKEDRLLRTLSAAEVAKRTGRTLSAVYMRRNKLGLPDARHQSSARNGVST